jgi:protein Tex
MHLCRLHLKTAVVSFKQITMEFAAQIAQTLQISIKRVESTLQLHAEGGTIPFIARYRKEATGSLDEVQIAEIIALQEKCIDLEKRRKAILESIEEQGKLTPELRKAIVQATTLHILEDLYLPYKQKRKTRATMAIDKGLEPLATLIFQFKSANPKSDAAKYLNDQVTTIEDALAGANDIMAEWINEDAKTREKVRWHFGKSCEITSKLVRNKEEEGAKYRDYFEWTEPLKSCPSHRFLAMLRGEEEGFLRLTIAPIAEDALYTLEQYYIQSSGPCTGYVQAAIHDSYKRLLQPSIETEFRNSSKEKADQEAIGVFTENLKQLLLSAPLGEHAVLGVDPGFRSGCKLVCLDKNGNLLHHTVIYPHPPQQDLANAERVVKHLENQYGFEAIAVGNGTAGRETIDFLRSVKFTHQIEIYQVNEAGASIYSASEVAREEFPNEDLTVRGAISIGRRLMDPLSELVKIDPKSIGVGQYQHDVNQTMLKSGLDMTVINSVNSVGINLNTASKHLLTYVSGLGPILAQNIVKYRQEYGAFKSRAELRKIPRLGDKAFEQCAGFLRIKEATNPLDNTGVHPERYALIDRMAKDLKATVTDLIHDKATRERIALKDYVSQEVGLPTLQDIMRELEKPGLDPRGQAKAFEFGNVRQIEDLSVGMVLPGIVTNITNFGAFVDIGIKDSGLVHLSQMAHKFIKNPNEVVTLNQQVTVKVVEIDMQRRRVALTMKL